MSAPLSDTFGQQLLQMRSDVIAQIRAQRGGKVGRAEAASDPRDIQSSDWTQADSARDLDLAMGEREAGLLSAIDTALQRIASGEYGLCIDCGIEIPTARLHANPTALRCLACQDTAEHARGGESHPSM